MASSGSDHAVREQSRSPVPRCRARATVSPRPTPPTTKPLHLGTLHHCSNWVAPTRLRLPMPVPWHRLRGLRSYKQGEPFLHHMPLTHAPCLAPRVSRAPHPSVPAVRVRLVQSMAVVGDGRIPGLGWTLHHHGDLVMAPLDSLGGLRQNAAQNSASAYPPAPPSPPTHGLVQE